MVAFDCSAYKIKKVNFYVDCDEMAVLKKKLYGNGLLLKKYSQKVRSQKELVLAAIKSNPWALIYASNELKDNMDVVRQAVKRDGRVLTYASRRLQNNIELVKFANSKEWSELYKGY